MANGKHGAVSEESGRMGGWKSAGAEPLNSEVKVDLNFIEATLNKTSILRLFLSSCLPASLLFFESFSGGAFGKWRNKDFEGLEKVSVEFDSSDLNNWFEGFLQLVMGNYFDEMDFAACWEGYWRLSLADASVESKTIESSFVTLNFESNFETRHDMTWGAMHLLALGAIVS